MKKILLLLSAFAFITITFAASYVFHIPPKATDVYISVNENTRMSLMELSTINVKDYQLLSGQKMNFFERVAFKAGQKKLRKGISADGTITNKKLAQVAADMSSGFHLGGFALGFFVGLIGVLIAYLIKGDEAVHKNRIKWAWIGFGAWVVILVIALAL